MKKTLRAEMIGGPQDGLIIKIDWPVDYLHFPASRPPVHSVAGPGPVKLTPFVVHKYTRAKRIGRLFKYEFAGIGER